MIEKYGKIVKNEWIKTGIIRKNIILDEFIVMPNHLHGIIIITESIDPPRREIQSVQTVRWVDSTEKNNYRPTARNPDRLAQSSDNSNRNQQNASMKSATAGHIDLAKQLS